MKKYIGVFEIHTPSGHTEKYQVQKRNKGDIHFTSSKQAANAAMRAGHVKLQSRRYPIGSHKVAYAEERNVVSDREIERSGRHSESIFKSTFGTKHLFKTKRSLL